MTASRPVVGTTNSPRGPRISAVLALLTLALFSLPASAGSTASLPRILLRETFGVPASRADEVQTTVASAVRDAGGAAIRCRDFARLAEARPDVKAILDGARAKVKIGIRLDKRGKSSEAVKSFLGGIDDYDSVGMEVWNPEELASAWAHLAAARAHVAQAAKKPMGSDVVDACKRAKALFPLIQLSAKEFTEADIAAFKKATTAAAPPPGPPGEGFWSLARVVGLDGIVESRSDDNGVLSLRAHRIKPASVRSTKIASKAAGLDASARQQLNEALGFVTTAAAGPAVASAPTPRAKATPVFLSETEPDPVVTPTAKSKASPTPKPAATPAPAPAPAITVALDAPATTPGSAVAELEATPEAPERSGEAETARPASASARVSGLPGGESSIALVGGLDHRAAVYSATDHFVNASSGDGGSAELRLRLALGRNWTVDASAGGIRRSYFVASNVLKTGTATEASAHVLHGDDANGFWWVGGGLGWISEPKFILVSGPSRTELVPSVTRLTPGVIGEARFALLPRLAVRGRGEAAVAIETTGASFGAGIGLDLSAEVSAAFAMTDRVRLTAGGAMHRITSQYSKKQTEVEARRTVWAGVEAAF